MKSKEQLKEMLKDIDIKIYELEEDVEELDQEDLVTSKMIFDTKLKIDLLMERYKTIEEILEEKVIS